MKHKQETIQYRETLEDGTVIEVPNLVVDWYNFGESETEQWEQCFSGESMRRIEEAILAIYPNWYHEVVDGKHSKDCKRCQGKHLDKS